MPSGDRWPRGRLQLVCFVIELRHKDDEATRQLLFSLPGKGALTSRPEAARLVVVAVETQTPLVDGIGDEQVQVLALQLVPGMGFQALGFRRKAHQKGAGRSGGPP